jgi:hypothetical protein
VSKRTRWLLSIGVIAALMLGLQVAAFASHPEVSLTGSNFEIDTDANLKVDDAAPSTDWAGVGQASEADLGEVRQPDKDSGAGDDSFGNGSKEDTLVPSVVDGSIPPNKSDLLTFGVYLEQNAAGKFLNLYWHRVQEPSGTTNMDFEFNQSETISSNGVTPVRTAGDLLIQYDLASGGTHPELFLSEWVTTGNKSLCEAANSTPCWGDRVNLTAAGDATGSINTSAIDETESDGLGDISPRTFGEAQIDFDALTGGGADNCVSFGSAYLKSRSSDSFTAAMKDFIAPTGLGLDNCGQVIIRKQTNPDKTVTDPDPTFGYTTNVNVEGTTDPTTFSLQDDGVQTISNVLQGSYNVAENAPTGGWEFVNIDCNVAGHPSVGVTPTPDANNPRQINFTINDPDDVVDCTYFNRQLTTTLGTEQSFVPQDKATIGGSPASGFDGTVDFRLYSGSTCAGTLLYEDLDNALSATTGGTAETNNPGGPASTNTLDGLSITGNGSFSWKVTYEGDTAADGALHPPQESCVEDSTVTISNT